MEVPFEFDDQALDAWRVSIPQSLAGEFTQAAARGNRGPGRVLEVLLTLSLELAETGIDVVDLLNAALPGAKSGMDVLRVIEEATVGAAPEALVQTDT